MSRVRFASRSRRCAAWRIADFAPITAGSSIVVQIPKFSVSIEPQGETVMVHIIGDAGITNADELGRRLLPVTAMRPAIVVIDVQQMSFIASLGLSILMEFQRGINRQGGQVRLLKPQPGVRDMLKKCRLDVVLQVIDSLDELPKPVA